MNGSKLGSTLKLAMEVLDGMLVGSHTHSLVLLLGKDMLTINIAEVTS